MSKPKSFTLQLIIIGGFILFFYIFFALATQIYKDYKIQQHIAEFEGRIDELANLAEQKPEDVVYFSSPEYKDRYAKENLNLLNPGEKLIIIPQNNQNIIRGSRAPQNQKTSSVILELPNRNQWWEYFFGQTLSISSPPPPTQELLDPSAQDIQG